MSGESASLIVACSWTITAIMFERAAKIFGSLALNPIRLFAALIFLSLFSFFSAGSFFSGGVTGRSLLWLSASGFVGFFIGDYFLFRAFEIIGSRIAMLIMSLAPVIASLIGYVFLGEFLSLTDGFAVLIIFCGISAAVLSKKNGGTIRLNHPVKGILAALIGAVSQGAGLVLAKNGMQGLSAVTVTQVRVTAGFAAFILAAVFSGKIITFVKSYANRKGLAYAAAGSFFGPFIGVALSMYAISKTEVGVASAIMSIVPVLLVPAAFLMEKKPVRPAEILGIIIAVSGVAILFLL